MTIIKESCKNFLEMLQQENKIQMTLVSVSCLAGFGSHNYSPTGNTPSHQLYTKLSVAANTKLQLHVHIQIQMRIQIHSQPQINTCTCGDTSTNKSTITVQLFC